MEQETLKPIKELRLKNTVVTRRLPMDQTGSDNLRAARDYFIKQYKERRGEDVRLSMPATIHLVLSEFRSIKGF